MYSNCRYWGLCGGHNAENGTHHFVLSAVKTGQDVKCTVYTTHVLDVIYMCTEAEFLDEIQTKILRVFPLIFPVTSTALLFLQTHAACYSLYSSSTGQYKGERRKTWYYRKTYPLPYGFRTPYRNLKPENSQDFGQKPQQNCTSMNSACVTSVF